ncbi:hypothetical protein NBRC116592_07360 [Colwellia sp. KU-HH00111]|uniref:EAL domain-containing protein n=1 Tax=Colwellia sp. KU-HH00111 TaxID=3127652 RepID=UPI00310A5193
MSVIKSIYLQLLGLFLSMFKHSAAILLTFVISMAFACYAVHLLYQYNYQQKYITVQKIAASFASQIRTDLNQTLSAAYPLAALVRAQNGKVTGFTELATEMLALYPSIASLQLSPNGVLKYSVPIEGNELAIGHDFLSDPTQDKEAQLAISSGKLTLAGPFNLIQGGVGAIARLPIFLNSKQGQVFWGFSSVLIRFPEALNTTNLSSLSSSGIGYQLSRKHSDTGHIQIIASSNTKIIDAPEVFNIPIPNGHWTFIAYPIDGWSNTPALVFSIFVGLLFVSLTTFLAFLLTRLKLSNLRLQKMVIKRTKDLQGNIERYVESERRLLLSQKAGGIITWEWDIVNNIITWSAHALKLFGKIPAKATITLESFLDNVHADDKAKVVNALNQCIESGVEYNVDHRIILADGSVLWINEKADVVRDHRGKAITMLGASIDITERKKIEDKLQLSAQVFSDTHEGIIITDSHKHIVDVNPAFCQVTGYKREEVIGKNPRFLSSNKQDEAFYQAMWQSINKHGHWQGEVWNRKKTGELYAELLTISVLKDADNNTVNYVGMFTDITRSKLQQEQLSRIAHYDILTNLPNRVLLTDRITQSMLQCNRHKLSMAVVFLDLDGFKQVNDVYGHDAGDKLLVSLSVRMKDALREGDSLARLGGDEFVAVLSDLAKVEDCEPVLERLLEASSAPVTIEEQIFNVSASIGVTLYPQDNVAADQLMRHADQAMYKAKELGKNRYHLFDTVQDVAIKEQHEVLEAIRTALDNQQFVLYYQPKVNMRTGEVTGVEALIRWQHPTRGLLSPIEFLPSIENNPMMIELGEWVINTALQQISQWQTTVLTAPVKISVNIAAVQLQQPDFAQKLASLLAAHPNIKPQYLELEVLETSALESVNHGSKIMNACKALGVNFALDDFGTGYSSLTYLRRLPADLIKIDQSFIRDMLHDADDFAIVEGVIALAKSFKREVIAEGVETVEHGVALLQIGCELAQGYGIAKPMPGNEIPGWISHWQPDASWSIKKSINSF